LRQARQIDQRDLAGTGGIAGEVGIFRVGPALHIGAALAEAGIDAFLDLAPFLVIDDFCRDLDAFFIVVEGDGRNFSGRHLAVHGAQIAEAFAPGGLGEIRRPLFVIRFCCCVIADFARTIRQFRRGVAIYQTLGGVRLLRGMNKLSWSDTRALLLMRQPRLRRGWPSGRFFC